MNFQLNAIIIVVICVVVVFLVRKFVKGLDEYEPEELENNGDEDDVNIDWLVDQVARAFTRTLKKSINDDNLSKASYIRKQKATSALREALTEAPTGNTAAKKTVKHNIHAMITSEELGINEKNIDDIIDFSNPARLSSVQKFEILLYFYNQQYAHFGFSEMVKEWGLDKSFIENGEQVNRITKRMIDNVFQKVFFTDEPCKLTRRNIEYEDKLEVLTQCIYERYIGLSVVDMLLETDIDGIDAGASGIPKDSFSINNGISDMPYSYESVYITYHGVNIHMECLTFGTQDELERVCKNIYKYDAQETLSRRTGKVVGTMMDGSRIVVVRPPFANSYAFFLRKFDSAPSIEPEKLIIDENNIIPILTMKWLIRGQRNIGITGGQATGKTTLLKSVVRFIDPLFNLRVQELKAELNLNFAYPKRNIVSFQETDTIDAQQGLDIQKKTNGAVNIYGEVASAIQASHLIQTSMVASLFALFTHHAKTAVDLIEALSNNLLELGLYNNKQDAVTMTAQVINIDCHLVNIKGDRHVERITEIIPVKERKYPSEELDLVDGKDKVIVDTPEYYKRVTNPTLYQVKDLVVWEALTNEDGEILKDGTRELGIFKMINYPSEEMLKEIKSKLTFEEEKEFEHDLEMMMQLSNGNKTEEVEKWILSTSLDL